MISERIHKIQLWVIVSSLRDQEVLGRYETYVLLVILKLVLSFLTKYKNYVFSFENSLEKKKISAHILLPNSLILFFSSGPSLLCPYEINLTR